MNQLPGNNTAIANMISNIGIWDPIAAAHLLESRDQVPLVRRCGDGRKLHSMLHRVVTKRLAPFPKEQRAIGVHPTGDG